jgi:hypothetical protein
MPGDNATNILHRCLSQAVSAMGKFPPANEGDGFDVLDIVLVRPRDSKGETLIATGANIGDVLSEQDKNAVQREYQSRMPSPVQKSLSAAGMSHAEITGDVKALVAELGMQGALDDKVVTDIVILGEASKFIRGNVAKTVEGIVASSFPQLLANTSLSQHVRSNFLFGVITGAITGELAATATVSNSGTTEIEIAAHGVGVHSQGQKATSSSIKMCGRGVIGVRMLCFAARLDSKARTYQLSAPITVVHANDEYFSAAREFVKGGGLKTNVIKMARVKKNLFRGTHIMRPDDVDEETREAYLRVIGTQGSRPYNPTLKLGNGSQPLIICGGSQADDVVSKDGAKLETLMTTFGPTDGKALWNSNDLNQPSSEGAHKPMFAVTDLDALDDAILEKDLRWLPASPLPSTVSVVDNATE